MWHAWGRSEILTEFWWGKLKDRSFGKPRHMWKDNVKMDLMRRMGERVSRTEYGGKTVMTFRLPGVCSAAFRYVYLVY